MAGIEGGRGFTGHEHLDEFGLINMNGRVYDPMLGMFLSPDNYIQAPDFTQNYNRYAYAWGNPMMYTDPSGEYIQWIIGGFIGGLSNVRSNADNIHGFKDWLAYYAIGNLAGDESFWGDAGFANKAWNWIKEGGPVIKGAYNGGSPVDNPLFMLMAGPVGPIGYSNGMLKVSQRSLQHMFSRHGADFGVFGNWSKARAIEFENVLSAHVRGIEPIQGTYRGTQQVLHYFNSNTGLNVMTDLSGNLIGGWKLSADQIKYLLTTGAIK